MARIQHVLWAIQGEYSQEIAPAADSSLRGRTPLVGNATEGGPRPIAVQNALESPQSTQVPEYFEPLQACDALEVWFEMQELLGATGTHDVDGVVRRLEQEFARRGLSARTH